MRRLMIIFLMLVLLVMPVSAEEWEAPEAPQEVQEYIFESGSFMDDLRFVLKKAFGKIQPDIHEAISVCAGVIAVMLLVSIVHTLPGSTHKIAELVGTLSIGILLLQTSTSLIRLGTNTIEQLTDYSKLLLPVMTAALAAQGGVSSAAALNIGTTFLNSVLTTLISAFLVPLVYIYLFLCLVNSLSKELPLKELRNTVKWLLIWSLKILLYVFTGFMSITNVISGNADAMAIKATKLTISGAVPVVGNILSDASETILVSTGMMKNSAGIYGLIVLIAILIGPFLKIGVHYLLLKITAAVSSVFGVKEAAGLVKDFSEAMGLILAMTGTVCLLSMISVVCFLKGVS